jgi:anthranilate phosphoribosyltransferase
VSRSAITTGLGRLAAGENLSEAATRELFGALDDPDTGPDRDCYYLMAIAALMAKGPTGEELAGIVADIAQRSVDLGGRLSGFGPLVDLSGTGGDRAETPNVGSLASFVTAAGGVPVAKQATRAFTGLSGSAEVYALLGLDVMDAGTDRAVELLRQVGVTALHTPSRSAAFAPRLAVLRRLRELDLRFVTPWHLVSWVYSPFPLTGRVYGVFDDAYRQPVADIFGRRSPGVHALVVHGEDGTDEISVTGPTRITEIRHGGQTEFRVTPDSLGLPVFAAHEASVHTREDFLRLRSGQTGAQERAVIRDRAMAGFGDRVFAILAGEGRPAHEALVAANAGAALYAGGRTDSLADGAALALELLRSGAARETARAFAQACGNSAACERLAR